MKQVSFDAHVGGLSRLLATENVNVTISDKVEDPCFDVKKRLLLLPRWVDSGNEHFTDLVIEHEMGHALYTPSDYLPKSDELLATCINVVEDIRIEKLMKLRFPGARKDFWKGYTWFYEQPQMEPLRKAVSEDNLSAADRINVRAKFGHVVNVPMDSVVEDLYNRCNGAETFEDVLALAEELKNLMIAESKGQKKQPQATTVQMLKIAQRHKTCSTISESLKVVQYPKIPFEQFIVPREAMKKVRDSAKNRLYEPALEMFLKKNRSVINTMMIEFEARKAAAMLSKQKLAKTGSLDLRRVAERNLTDEIFRTVMRIPEGKNHGVIMLLDQSYSMHGYYQNTINQALVLLEFCRRSAIPVSLFGFGDRQTYQIICDKQYNHEFCLKPYVYPGMKRSEYWDTLKNLVQLSCLTDSRICKESFIGRTPLNGSLAVLTEYAKAFKEETNADIINVVVLTDGSATDTFGETILGEDESESKVDYILIQNNVPSERLLHGSRDDQLRKLANFYRKTTGFNYICIRLTPKEESADVCIRDEGFDAIFNIPNFSDDYDATKTITLATQNWLRQATEKAAQSRRLATLIANELAV